MPPLEVALERARALSPLAAELVEPLLSFTLAPTMIEASKQRNVIPATCVVTVDCRLPPGMTPEDVDPLVRAAIGPGDYDLEWYERDGGTRSPMETPLWSALESWVGEIEPGRPPRAARLRRLHRFPLDAGGLRHGRLRILPAEGDGHRARLAAHPLCRRANSG